METDLCNVLEDRMFIEMIMAMFGRFPNILQECPFKMKTDAI
jgi:hypothetical protein